MTDDRSSWSNDRWMKWYDDNVAKDEQWQSAFKPDKTYGEAYVLRPNLLGVEEGSASYRKMDFVSEAMANLMGHKTIDDESNPSTADLLQSWVAPEGRREAFSRLSPEFKRYVYDWYNDPSRSHPTHVPPGKNPKPVELPESESILGEIGGLTAGTGPGSSGETASGDEGVESIIDEVEPAAAGGWPWRRWAVPIVIGGVIIAWWAFGVFGDSDEVREVVQESVEPAVATTVDEGIVVGAASAPDTTEEAAGACTPLESHGMTISSPDAPEGAIGLEWTRPVLREVGYPSPSFEITGVPAGATELAIIGSEISEQEASDFLSLPGADPRPLHAFYVLAWTGLEVSEDLTIPSFTAGGETSGATIRAETMLGAQNHAFVGSDSNGVLLFTVVALCEPPDEYWDPANLLWMEGRIADASLVVYVGG